MSGSIRLSAQDASFVERATPGTPMNVGGLIRLEPRTGGLRLDRVQELVGQRLRRVPALRARVERGPKGAMWADDPDFAVDRHVGALTIAADDRDLVETIAQLHATALPPGLPPWRLDVVPQGRSGGPALLFRASHALADGMSSMVVMRALFDRGRDDQPAGDRSEPPPRTDDAFEIGRDIIDSLDERRRQRLGAQEYERALVLLDGWLSMLAVGRHGLPRLPGSGPVRTRLALTEVSSPALRALRRQAKVRFDAIALTIVAAAVGRLLDARGQLPTTRADGPRIRTLVPVATSYGAATGRLGNHASFLLLALPIGAMEPRDRLRLVADELDEAARAGQQRAAAMSMRALETAPDELTDRINRFTAEGRFVDLVVSCVPGPRRALTFDELQHAITHAMLPITEQVRLAVGWADIAGRCGVAITFDEGAVPERAFFVRAVEQAAASLLGSFGSVDEP